MHQWNKKLFLRNKYTITLLGGMIKIVGINTVNFVFRYKKRPKNNPLYIFYTKMIHKYFSLLQQKNRGKDQYSEHNLQRVEVILSLPCTIYIQLRIAWMLKIHFRNYYPII